MNGAQLAQLAQLSEWEERCYKELKVDFYCNFCGISCTLALHTSPEQMMLRTSQSPKIGISYTFF